MIITVSFGGKRHPAENLLEVSSMFRSWIESNNFGASDLRGKDGTVFDGSSSRAIARISYNGRIWQLDGREILCAS